MREKENKHTPARAHVYKLLSGPGNKNGPLRSENGSLMGVIYIITTTTTTLARQPPVSSSSSPSMGETPLDVAPPPIRPTASTTVAVDGARVFTA